MRVHYSLLLSDDIESMLEPIPPTKKKTKSKIPKYLLAIGIVALVSMYFKNSMPVIDLDSFWNGQRNTREAADNVTLLLNRVAPIARITNAIYLQNGVLTEKINMDAFVELFNMGPITVDALSKLSSTNIDAFASKLTEARRSFGSSSDGSEEYVLASNEIRKKSGAVPKVEFTKEMKEYFDACADFGNQFNDSIMAEITKMLNKVITGSSELEAVTGVRDKDQKLADVASFSKVITGFQYFLEELTAMKAFQQDAKSSVFRSGPAKLQPFANMIKSMTSRQASVGFGDVQKKIEVLVDLRAASTVAVKDIVFVKEVVKAYIYPHSTLRTFTAGFSNGASDISKLTSDFNSRDFRNAMKITLQLKSLITAVDPITSIPPKIKPVREGLAKINSKQHDSIRHVQKLQMDLSSVEISKEDATKVLEFYKSTTAAVPVQITQPVSQLLNTVNQLSNGIDSIASFIGHLTDQKFQESIKAFLQEMSFKDMENPDKEETGPILDKIKSNGTLANIMKTFQTIKSELDSVLKLNLGNVSTNIIKTPLDTFLATNEAKAEQQLQDNFRTLEPAADKVSQSIHMIQNFRVINKDPKTVEELKEAVSTIVTGSMEVKKLDLIKEMKKHVPTETEVLQRRFAKADDLVIIGSVAFGLQKMVDFKGQKESIDKLILADGVVAKEIAKLGTRTRRAPNLSSQWGNSDSLKAGLDKINEIDSMIGKPDNYKTFGDRLKNIPAIQNVEFDGESKKRVLEQLLPVVTDPQSKTVLTDAQQSIEKLENVDLKFAQYSSSFANANTAFSTFQSNLEQFLVETFMVTDDQGWLEEAWAWLLEKFYVLIIAGIILLIIIFLSVCACRRHNKKKKLKAEANKKRGATPSASAASTATAAEAVPLISEVKPKEKKDKKGENSKKSKDSKDSKDSKTNSWYKPVELNSQQRLDFKVRQLLWATEVERLQAKAKAESQAELEGSSMASEIVTRFHAEVDDLKMETIEATADEVFAWCTRDMTAVGCIHMYNAMYSLIKEHFLKFKEIDYKIASKALPKSKHRNFELAPQNPSYMIRSDETPLDIFGVQIKSPDGEVLVTQAPIGTSADKDDTREAFWNMIMTKKVKCIAMICRMDELNGEACGVYFMLNENETVMCGRFEVKTDKVEEGFGCGEVGKEVITTRTLTVTDTKSNEKSTVTQYQHHEWPVYGIPNHDVELITDLCRVMTAGEKDKPILIHSSLGTGRAIVVAGMILGVHYVNQNPNCPSTAILNFLNLKCWTKTFSVCQILYMNSGIRHQLLQKNRDKASPEIMEKHKTNMELLKTMGTSPLTCKDAEKARVVDGKLPEAVGDGFHILY